MTRPGSERPCRVTQLRLSYLQTIKMMKKTSHFREIANTIIPSRSGVKKLNILGYKKSLLDLLVFWSTWVGQECCKDYEVVVEELF